MIERQFLVDINPDMELPKYELILYSLYEQPVAELLNITSFMYRPFFIGIDEISFNIPMTRNEADGQIVRNEIYDMVDGEYYIKINDSKFFVINKINEKTNDDGFTYKEVSAYSREAELNQKRLVDYRASSRMLYDRENTMLEDENGQLIERGILNYIFNHITKAWTIGTVDEKVVSLTNQGISRELNFPNSSLIQVFQELQKTYNCVFKFNTTTQVIDVKSAIDYDLKVEDIANSPQYKGLYISDENFIKSMSKNIEYDKVKTRLFLYGKDNVSIQSIHPTGQPYIDNFSAFKTTKFMTQELIDGLNAYELLIQNANPNFTPLLNQLQTKNAELEELYNKDDAVLANKGLVALKRELSLVQTNIDTRVADLAIIRETIAGANGTDLSSLHAEMKTIQTEIDGFEAQKTNINSLITIKESQITSKKDEIASVENQIQGIRDDLSVQASLAPHLVKELDKFVRVETCNDSNFTENNIMELYEEGKKNLAKISQPSIQFDLDVVDFLSIIECQHTWDKFVLGDIVLLEHKDIGFNFYVRLVGYEHNPDSNSLRLQFSNTNSFDDATLWIKDLLEQMNNTSSTLDFNKYKWDKTENMQSDISKIIDAKLEEARQNILNAVGQRHLFDDTGLWLYKENPDNSINPEQIRAINNTIALTENNWQTVGTAITPKGVVAPAIYGKLGRFALVQANKIEVGGDFDYDWSTSQPTTPYQIGQTWLDNGVSKICVTERLEGAFNPDDWKLTIISHIDQETKELDDSVKGLGDTINNAFSDGMITNIEANSLHLARNNVAKEAEDVKDIATSLSVSTTAITNAINNLNTQVNKYVGKSSYPIEITPSNRTLLLNAFTDLEAAIVSLYQAIDEKRVESVKVHQIILSNENQSIVTNSDGIVTALTEVRSEIDVFRGITKVSATIGAPVLKDKDGNTITFGTIAKTNPTNTVSGSVKWTIPSNTNISSESGWIEIPISIAENGQTYSYVKKLTWNKARAGAKGDIGVSAIVGVLSNNSHTVPTDSLGNNGNYAGCSTTMSIYVGSTNDSANWTITATTGSGITGNLSGRTYTVTNMTTDTGYVDLTAKRSGYADIIMRFNISKNKQGGIGQSATAYWLVTDVSAINKSQTGVYTPASLNINAKSQVGTSSPSAYAGRFVIAETTDGTTFVDKYTSSANESSKSYTPSAGIKAIRIRLYLAGGVSNLIDEEIIPIVLDGSNAKIVTIAPSHSSFISKSTASPIPASSYEPSVIVLTPSFQNCDFYRWEFYDSQNDDWIIIFSGSNNEQPRYDSSTLALSIPAIWEEYNEDVTSISFRAISETGEYDLITIPRLYDSTTLAENAVMMNKKYESGIIQSKAEGIEIYDGATRVLQMGGIATGATQTKNDYGFKASHTDGSFSAIVGKGFIKKYLHGEAEYTNNLYIETVVTADPGYITGTPPGEKIIIIPKSFAYQDIKNIAIVPVIKHFFISWENIGGADSTSTRKKHWQPIVEITPYLNTVNPYLEVTGWMEGTSFGSSGYGFKEYTGLEIAILLLMGKGEV